MPNEARAAASPVDDAVQPVKKAWSSPTLEQVDISATEAGGASVALPDGIGTYAS